MAGVVSGSSAPKLVQLEDCRTLEVSEYTEEEVVRLGLGPVSAPPAGHDPDGRGQSPPRGTTSTGVGLERTSPDETPPSSTLRTGP